MTARQMMASELQAVFDTQIPLSAALGIRVLDYDGLALRLAAPLEPNRNLHGTAFAGSLYSVAVAAGWGLVYLLLREAGLQGHIVIRKSSTSFDLPVDLGFVAVASLDSHAILSEFLGMYRTKGRAGLDVTTLIRRDEKRIALEFAGRYVVYRDADSQAPVFSDADPRVSG